MIVWPTDEDVGSSWGVPSTSQKRKAYAHMALYLPWTLIQLPLAAASSFLGLGLFGNPKWSVKKTCLNIILKFILGERPLATNNGPDVVSIEARSSVPKTKDAHRTLVSILARPQECVGDAKHDAVRPEDCPGFFTWPLSGESPLISKQKGKVLMYLVGGAYVTGHPLLLSLDVKMTTATGLPVFSVNFRKACHPHLSFPAALQDAVAGFYYLLDLGFKAEDVIICGDSAGGGLAITTCLYLQKEGLQIPGKTFLISPWVDLCVSKRNYDKQRLARDFLSCERLEYAAIQYTWHRRTFQKTLLSPVLNQLPEGYSFKGFPRTLITYATDEIFFNEDEEFAHLLEKNGVEVESVVEPDDVHVYCKLPLRGLDLPIFQRLKTFTT
jgi:acetyl esterase/lipase